MKKHTKPIIFLVVLILLAFAIVGCGSKTGINNDVDNKADAKSGEERDEEDENLNINKEDIRDKYEARRKDYKNFKLVACSAGQQ
ncbi:hypothetical protein, partial [Acetivibrio saccincola]|uniref:hypothetical protein n=1 Tax=Acetivibrio saccincola TaxID=1677857 RepID=UPI002D0E908F|nr:hypothetical protein [Acetivibrio saccincola]